MYRLKNSFVIALTLLFTMVISCKDLDELNINPNGVDPAVADLNLLLPTIITSLGQNVTNMGFGDMAGVMQHTQKDGWSGGHNDYDWTDNSHNWSAYYGILRNNEEFYKKAVAGDFEFHQGVALVLRAYTFGLIADLWGDAPYTDALKAESGADFFKPKFDAQKDIYYGILADLEEANTLLSKTRESYRNISNTQDVLYRGDVTKWRKFANSLALRYYMRLSEKERSFAEQGIRKITGDPAKYPLISAASEDATVAYIGSSPGDSWPSTEAFNPDPSGNYMRVKMCATLVDKMQDYNDPRIAVWANKVTTPLVLVAGTNVSRIVNGVREVSQDIVDAYEKAWGVGVDYDPNYVGIPPSVFAASQYNLNPNLDQGVFNPHASHLNSMYRQSSGSLLRMRLHSAAEVHFLLAEAALYGWASGAPATHYANAIQESFTYWGVSGAAAYVTRAPYSGLESIITQKWIASWTSATESWFDYRRTGFPVLQTGESAKRAALPIRFYYHFIDEISKNTANAEAAISKLEATGFKGTDMTNNSAWSKTWLLQGTNKPY